jgi:hypothetical protein
MSVVDGEVVDYLADSRSYKASLVVAIRQTKWAFPRFPAGQFCSLWKPKIMEIPSLESIASDCYLP